MYACALVTGRPSCVLYISNAACYPQDVLSGRFGTGGAGAQHSWCDLCENRHVLLFHKTTVCHSEGLVLL